MKIEYDKEVDALYIRIQEKYVARTQEVAEGVNLDFDADGRLIGLEVIDATKCYSLSDIFNLSTENSDIGQAKNRRLESQHSINSITPLHPSIGCG